MLNRNACGILCAALLFAHLPAAAQTGVSAVFGTTGVGAQLHTPLAPQLSARLGANIFNYDYTSSTSDLNYDAEARLRTIDALLDWHPAAGGFRITGGVIVNNNKVFLYGRPSASGSFTFSGRTYSVSDIGTVDGVIRFRRLAPYLGVGWSSDGSASSQQPGWSFTSDIGIMFQGKPRASLNSSGCDLGRGLLGNAICTQLERDIPNESARLEEEVDQYRYFPVVRIGATYRF